MHASYFNYLQIMMLAAAGGILGVLFMVPLRRALIVADRANLPYPEGTACADDQRESPSPLRTEA